VAETNLKAGTPPPRMFALIVCVHPHCARNSRRNVMPCHASSSHLLSKKYRQIQTEVVGIFVFINVLNSLKCMVTPLFFSINQTLPLLVLCILFKILLLFLLKYDQIFVRMHVYMTYLYYYLSVRLISPEEMI